MDIAFRDTKIAHQLARRFQASLTHLDPAPAQLERIRASLTKGIKILQQSLDQFEEAKRARQDALTGKKQGYAYLMAAQFKIEQLGKFLAQNGFPDQARLIHQALAEMEEEDNKPT